MARPKSETKRQKVILNLLEADYARLGRVIEARGWDLAPAAGARELLRERMSELEGEMAVLNLERRVLYGGDGGENEANNAKELVSAGGKRPLSGRWDTED